MDSSFQPIRSSPKKPTLKFDLANVTAVSSASSTASAALSGLSSDDISLIDEIIERAPSSATAFITVFKAYNEVLQEKGMDPSTDIVYYRMLLKLGVIRGRDWGEKWQTVKQQFGYDSFASSREENTPRAPNKFRSVLSRRDSTVFDVDSITVHSHQESDSFDVEDANVKTPHHLLAGNSLGIINAFSEKPSRNILGLTTEPTMPPPLPSPSQFRPVQARRIGRNIPTVTSVSSEQNTLLSSTPPSYNAVVNGQQEKPPVQPSHVSGATHSRPERTTVHPPKQSVLNEDEAWLRVRISQDEKEADRFRRERLLERCWGVWKNGLEWIVTTGRQLDLARDHIVKRTYLQQWRSVCIKKIADEEKIAKLADSRFIRHTWNIWRKKLKEKRLNNWKNDMRKKMTVVKEKRNNRIKADAWAKWRQLWQSHLSGQQYSVKLCIRMFDHWKSRLRALDQMDVKVHDFKRRQDNSMTVDAWELWRRRKVLLEKEQHLSELVGGRIKEVTWKIWKSHMHDNHTADLYYDVVVLRGFFRMWQAAISRVAISQQKADKYRTRQQAVLLRAVMHVWVSRERAALLERVRLSRVLHNTWEIWRSRHYNIRELEDRATTFTMVSSTFVLRRAIDRWRQALFTFNNAMRFATTYYHNQLCYKAMHHWRVDLRMKLRMVKQARIARRYLLKRFAWNVWKTKIARKKREKLLEIFKISRQRKVFQGWREHVLRNQYDSHASRKIQMRINLRIMTNILKIWTMRVIDFKLREIEAGENRDRIIVTSAFSKWKAIRSRHVEDLSLMQSYHDIKQEETIRRIFHRWLSATRATRYRRLALQQFEENLRQRRLQLVWMKWREHARANFLKPLEDSITIQFQRNLLFRSFGIWHSKTESIPAILFYNSRAKSRYWKNWRSLMPKALQAKQARQMDRESVLGKALDKWVTTYRTKMALKAVARARYLRLPTGPRPNLPDPSATSVTSRTSGPYLSSNRSSFSKSSEKVVETDPDKPLLLITGASRRWAIRPASRDNRSVKSSIAGENNCKSDVAGSDRPRATVWSDLREEQKNTRLAIGRPRSAAD